MDMINVMFNQTASVKTKKEALQSIAQFDGVEEAQLVDSDFPDSIINSLAVVYLQPGADANSLVKKIEAYKVVDKAWISPERRPL